MNGSKPSQRERLVAATTAVTARYGYREASVARIVAQAKVSRATFYENFADRDDCVLAAYREIGTRIERGLERIAAKAKDGGTYRRTLAELLADAERDPAATRVFLVESLAAGADVRSEHERLLDRAEARVDAALNDAGGDRQLEIPARALLGGIAGVVSTRVVRGEAGRLSELLDDLVAWIDSYALSGSGKRLDAKDWAALGEGLAGGEPESLGDDVLNRRLPRGRGALPPSLAASEQRERILAAVARLSRETGYTAMTVADIVDTASVTRETFYELFRGKEEAFLATQAFGLEQSVALTAGKFFNKAAWRDRVWSGAEAMLGYVAGQRDLVFIDLIESYAAGAAAIRRSIENRMAYTLFLEDGYRESPEAEDLSRLCSEAIGAAIHELMRHQVASGRGERMLEILPQMAYLTLAPFVGARKAMELVEAKLTTASCRTPTARSSGRRAEA